MVYFFFFNDTATTEIYTLSLHDALPICPHGRRGCGPGRGPGRWLRPDPRPVSATGPPSGPAGRLPASASAVCGTGRRSEEHTSELQSRPHLVCRLLLDKKKFHATIV